MYFIFILYFTVPHRNYPSGISHACIQLYQQPGLSQLETANTRTFFVYARRVRDNASHVCSGSCPSYRLILISVLGIPTRNPMFQHYLYVVDEQHLLYENLALPESGRDMTVDSCA